MKATFCIAAVVIACVSALGQTSIHSHRVVHSTAPSYSYGSSIGATEQPLPFALTAPGLTAVSSDTPKSFYNDATVKSIYAEATKINGYTSPIAAKYKLLYKARQAKLRGDPKASVSADNAQLKTLVQQMSLYTKRMGELSKLLSDKESAFLKLEAAKIR